MNRYLLILFSLLGTSWASSQTVEGYITDAKGPISYATVHVKGGSYGVVSNVKGFYIAHLAEGQHTLVFESLGYQPIEKVVQVRGEIRLDIRMTESEEVLQTVVVDKDREDPAYAIIRKVMATTKSYNKGLETYQESMYLKASLEMEDLEHPDTTTPDLTTRRNVNLIESISDVYFQRPNQFKEIKHAFRDNAEQRQQTVSFSVSVDEKGRESVEITNPFLYFTRIVDGDLNIHTDQLEVPKLAPTPILSPVGKHAMDKYAFRLLESFREDGVMIYRIKVIPKSPMNTVEGELYIRDESFTVHALDLEFKRVKLHFFDRFQMVQDYGFDSTGRYSYIQRQEFYYDAALPKNRTAFGHTTVYFDQFQPNVTVSKKFMRSGDIIFDPDSYKREEDYWANLRPIGLKKLEAQFVHTQDSIKTFHESVEYLEMQDSIQNHMNIWGIVLTGIQHQNTKKGVKWYFYPLVAQISINTVDGYRHKLGGTFTKDWKNGKQLEYEGSLSYGILNKNVRGETNMRFMYDPFTFSRIRLKYTHVYTMINLNNSIRATFSPSNYADNIGYGIGYEREIFNGFLLKSYVDYNQFRPYKGKTVENFWENFPLFSKPQDFAPFEELVLSLDARISFRQRYELRPEKKVILGTKYPIVRVHYSKGIKPFLKSDVNYDLLNVRSDHDIWLSRMGISRFSVQAGRFINAREVRISSLRYFRGSDRYYFSNPLQTFQLIGPLSLATSKAYFQGHYAHHFNGAILGQMRFFRRIGLQTAVGSSVLLLEETGMTHIESFAGLERPFRLWGQLFRFGTYYTAGANNINGASQGLKFGIDFYNGFSGNWQY